MKIIYIYDDTPRISEYINSFKKEEIDNMVFFLFCRCPDIDFFELMSEIERNSPHHTRNGRTIYPRSGRKEVLVVIPDDHIIH